MDDLEKITDSETGFRSTNGINGQFSDIGSISPEYSQFGNVKIQNPCPKIANSKAWIFLDNLLLSDPSKVEVFRKSLDRRSGKSLFRPFKELIVQFLDNTYMTKLGKVI